MKPSDVDLFDRSLLFFSGKGGVGKTTVSSAFAYACAQRGERTLLVQMNVKDKVNYYFGSGEIGPEIQEIEDNLHAVNITPDAALEEYGLMLLRLKFVYKAVFENDVVRSFLKAIPGLDELVMLGKAYYHAVETDSDDDPVWDKVIVDAPATGHGIFLLKIPSVIHKFLSSGHMYKKAKEIDDLLRQKDFTAINLVTLPEEMPVNETIMLRNKLNDDIGLDIDAVFANAVIPNRFNDGEETSIDKIGNSDSELSGNPFINAAQFQLERTELQTEHLQHLEDELNLPKLELPFQFTEQLTFPNIEALASEITSQLESS